MQLYYHTRSKGHRYDYTIEYAQGQYTIARDGRVLKSVPDSIILGITPREATPDLMLRMAIADIELLSGMEE